MVATQGARRSLLRAKTPEDRSGVNAWWGGLPITEDELLGLLSLRWQRSRRGGRGRLVFVKNRPGVSRFDRRAG